MTHLSYSWLPATLIISDKTVCEQKPIILQVCYCYFIRNTNCQYGIINIYYNICKKKKKNNYSCFNESSYFYKMYLFINYKENVYLP